VRDADNRFDPNAIAVGFPLGDGEDDVIIGYVPAARNEVLAKFLDMGWADTFECRISQIDPEEHYENQIRLTIWIKRKK